VGLDAPVSVIRGIGEKQAANLEKLGVRTIRDLLYLSHGGTKIIPSSSPSISCIMEKKLPLLPKLSMYKSCGQTGVV